MSTDRKHTLYTECNICRPVQMTPVDLQRGKVKTLATATSLSQCAVKYNTMSWRWSYAHYRLVVCAQIKSE